MAIKNVTVTINGSTVTLNDNGDGTYSKTLTAPTKTSYNVNSGHYYPVTIVATNMAGTSTTVDDTHASLGNSCKLKVKEVTAPTIAITSPTSSQYFGTATPQFTFTVTDEANGSAQSVTVTNGSFSKSVTLANGNNTIVVTATDKAGKVTTITRTIILDTSAPVVASVSITPNPVNVGGSYTVTVTVS